MKIVSSLLVLAIALPAPAIMIRHDRSDADYVRLGARYPAVASVQKIAEGVLVAPRWVLTAAHVGSELSPAGSFVEIAGQRVRVDAIVIHPEYFPEERSAHDLALLHLERAVDGITPAAPYAGNDELGMTVTFVGRGQTGDGKTGPAREDGVVRGATNVVDVVEANIVGFTFDAPPRATKLEGISGPGDSGGPALITRNGTLFTIGVSSANASERDGGGPCRYRSHEIYARVSSHREWIETTMRNAPRSNHGWSEPVWSPALPDTPLAARVRAFVDAVHGDAASMRAFRLANRPAGLLESRPEAKFEATESKWLAALHDARIEGYATKGERKLAVFLSTGSGKWFSFVFHGTEDADMKIGGILDGEMLPMPKATARAAATASAPGA
ncbi:MAG TPA: trypsin-like serine protease [Thermoanaerobaculia bacterium]|nr:trypsin-like serine protease [Thermoanaerobaculia bacterium]